MKNFTKFPTLKMTLVLLIGFFVSIAMGLSSCSDTTAQGLSDNAKQLDTFEMAPRPQEKVIVANEPIETHRQHQDRVTYVKTNKDNEITKMENVNLKPNVVGVIGTVTLNDTDVDLNGNLITYDVFQGAKGGLYIFRMNTKVTLKRIQNYISGLNGSS